MTTNVSLRGLKEYAITKLGISITPQHNHLRDLENLVNNMYAIRDGSTLGCGTHGNELEGQPRTICNGHSKIYNPNLSPGHFRDVFVGAKLCTCDSNFLEGCHCQTECICNNRCGCVSRCGCQTRCSCNCAQSS